MNINKYMGKTSGADRGGIGFGGKIILKEIQFEIGEVERWRKKSLMLQHWERY